MKEEPIICALSARLLEYLRGELVPAVLSEPDAIKLTHPGAENEFRLGISLYDIRELRSGGPPPLVRLSDEERRFPDLTLALQFLAFANRKAAFNSMEAEDEMLLLEAVLRAVHGKPQLEYAGEIYRLTFQPLECAEKVSLWQGLNCPFQPAVYLTVEPVSIPDARILRVPVVRGVQVSAKRKEERERMI